MKRSSILLAFLAISVVSAFPLVGEAFAQTPTEANLLKGAETASTTTVVVTFMEEVTGVDNDTFTVDGASATASVGDSQETETVTLTVTTAFATDARPLVEYAGADPVTTVATGDDAKQQTSGSIRAVDGVAPTLSAQAVTGPNEVTITYSEAVSAVISDYTHLRVTNPNTIDDTLSPVTAQRNIQEVQGSGTNTHTIAFYGTAAQTDATAQIDIGAVEDLTTKEDKNVFVGDNTDPGQTNVVIIDGQAPQVDSVMITGPNTITVQWTEEVTTTNADYVNIRVAGSRNIDTFNDQTIDNNNPEQSVTADSIPMTFGGDAVSTSATGVITINPVADTPASDNEANMSERQPNIVITDGQAPSLIVAPGTTNVEGLKITGPNTITLTANEAVMATDDTFSNLRIGTETVGDTADPAYREFSTSGSGTDTITISFEGDEAGPNATATIEIVDTGDDTLVDVAGNKLINLTGTGGGDTTTELAVEDGQAPTLESIGITNTTRITVVFSEAVNVQSDGNDFTSLRISGQSVGITSASGSGTATISLTLDFTAGIDFDNDGTNDTAVPTHATGTITIEKTVKDNAGANEVDRNSFAGLRNTAVAAAQAPSIESIKITGPNTITVEFSEDVTITGNNDFQNLRLRGESLPRDIDSVVRQSDQSMVTITFADNDDDEGAPTDATGTITVNDSITDQETPTAIPLVARQNMAVTDGQAPTLESIKITGPNTVTVVFSEAVNAEQEHFEDLMIGTETEAREFTNFTATATTYTIEFGGPAVDPDVAGTIDILEGITDLAENAFLGDTTNDTDPGQDDVSVVDGQAPTLESITITDKKQITAKFSENVTATRDGFVAFQVLQNGVSVNDYRNIGVMVPDQTADSLVSTDTVILTFSGRDAPLGSTGLINITGEVKDVAENEFASMADVTVGANQIPSVASADITGSNQVTIVFSENVSFGSDNFTNLTIDGEDSPREIITAVAGDTTDIVVITFDVTDPDGETDNTDNAVNTDATATIDIEGVTDTGTDRNVMEAVTAQAVGDKQNPTVKTSITGPNTVTVEFSEAVNATQDDFDDLSITGENNARNITAFEASSGAVYAITFAGDEVAGNAAGTIDIGDMITDTADNAFVGVDIDGNPDTVAGQDDVPVTDGQAPTLVRAEFLTGSAIGFAYSEPVNSARGAYTELLLSTGPDDYRNVIHSDTGTALITVNYAGEAVDDDVTATISIDDTIKDGPAGTPNLSLAPMTAEILPRSVPELVMIEITGPNEITAVFSEPVNTVGTFSDLRITGESSTRNVTTIAGSGTDTITITFAGSAVEADTTATMDIGDNASTTTDIEVITDLVGRAFETIDNKTIDAGQNPTLTSAMVTGPNEITLVFSESVMYVHNVTLSELFGDIMLFPGGDRNLADVAGEGTDTITITFDGSPVDTDATATITIGSGLTDMQGNPYAGETVTVGAGQAPTLTSVSIASDGDDTSSASVGDTVTITLTASQTIAKPDVSIHGSAADSVTNPTGDTWVASRTLGAGDADGTVTFTIDFESMTGTAGTQVTETTDGSSVTFNVAPMFGTAAVTGPNEVTVTFSKTVNASTSDFTSLVLVPGGARTITGISGSGTDTITLTFGGNASSTGTTASLTIGSGVTDLSGAPFDGPLSVDVSDGQAPTLISVSITSDNADSSTAAVDDTVTLTFTASEPLDSVDVTIDGVDPGAATDDSVTWTATKTVTGMDSGGAAVAFTIDYVDTASNAGAQVTDTTDGTSVTIARTSENTASVTGTVFSDTNGNGVQNDGELGIEGYTMIAINTETNQSIMVDTASDGTYTFDAINADTRFLIQTGFFPAGHTVLDVASSWFTYVEVEAGSTEAFNVGFYPVPQSERTTLNLTVYHDANINGVMDAGESGISGVMLTVYTYTIGPELVTTGPNGTLIKADLVPADWAITTIPEGYLPTAYSYERSDDTEGKVYDPAVLVADDPAPGSVHTMMIGLVPAQ